MYKLSRERQIEKDIVKEVTSHHENKWKQVTL